MKKKGKLRKLSLNILIWLIVLVAAFVTIVSISSRDNNGVANFMGFMPLSIQSGSMEPTIKIGDLILTKKYDGKTKLEEQDIITFVSDEYRDKNGNPTVITHRIIDIKENGGMISYVTKGDHNPLQDNRDAQPGDIISVYTGKKIGFVGKILDFLKSQWGFFIFIVLPLFIFFVYQLYTFIVLVIDSKKEQIIAGSKK